MKLYFVSEIYPHAIFRAGKHRVDLELSMKELGFIPIVLIEGGGIIPTVSVYLSMLKHLFRISKESLVHFHFPVRSRVKRTFLYLLKKRGVHCIAFTFDIDSLRDDQDNTKQRELAVLRQFDFIITQNEAMEHWLKHYIPHAVVRSVEFIDHRSGYNKSRSGQFLPQVAFAGNLHKATFIEKLGAVEGITFHVYGEGIRTDVMPQNVSYYGTVHPDVLPEKMTGSFGLVWDGACINTCCGPFGNYLRYNTPFKTATYLMAGLPLIVWEESALAEWTREQNVGMVVADLMEVTQRIQSLTLEEYERMCTNIRRIQPEMAAGVFYKNVLIEVINTIRYHGQIQLYRIGKRGDKA